MAAWEENEEVSLKGIGVSVCIKSFRSNVMVKSLGLATNLVMRMATMVMKDLVIKMGLRVS